MDNKKLNRLSAKINLFLHALVPYRLSALIKKEFLTIFKDPKNRALVIMPPVIQLVFFAQALTMEVRNIDISVLDYSNSYNSRELISKFYNSPWFRNVYFVQNPKDLKHDIDLKKSQLGLIIQNDFDKKIQRKQTSQVLIIADGRQTNSASLASSYAGEIIGEYNRELSEKFNIKNPKINVITRNWFNPNIEYKWFLTVSLIVMLALVLSLLLSALTIARERELGTFNQLKVSPLSDNEILLGKLIPPLISAFISSIIITLIIAIFFRVPFSGSVILYLIANFIALFSIIGIGLFISAISYTQQQAILGVFAFQTPAVLLSGFVSPVEDMNSFFRFLSNFNPLKYYMLIVKGIYFKNMDTITVVKNLIPLLIIGIFALYITVICFKGTTKSR